MLIGAQIAGALYNNFLGDQAALSPAQWNQFWWIPAGFAAVVMFIFFAFFKEESKTS